MARTLEYGFGGRANYSYNRSIKDPRQPPNVARILEQLDPTVSIEEVLKHFTLSE
jgi:hypothetical protein